MVLNRLTEQLQNGLSGEELARRDFSFNRDELVNQLEQIDVLLDSSAWTDKKYDSLRSELLRYVEEGRKLIGYRFNDAS